MKTLFTKAVHKKGFTLVEMLVYIAVMVIVCAAAVTLLFSLGDRITQQRANQLVVRTAQTTIERIMLEVRNAEAVDAGSVLENNPGTLILDAGATTTQFAVSGGVVEVTVNGGTAEALTSSDVSIEELRFFAYDNTLTELVRVVLTVEATVGDATVSKTFNASGVLRGSYE